MRTLPNRAVLGTYVRECYVCGMPFLRSEMVKREWDGNIVCKCDNYKKPVPITPKTEKPFKRD